MYIRYYYFRCSACSRKYTTSLSPILLGTGRRRCKKCNNVFADGTCEWPQMSVRDKFHFLFPFMVLIGIGLVTIILGAAFYIFENWNGRKELLSAAAILFAPLVLYFLWRGHLIRESTERFARHQAFGDTEEFILSA
jgi:hypothetical protein